MYSNAYLSLENFDFNDIILIIKHVSKDTLTNQFSGFLRPFSHFAQVQHLHLSPFRSYPILYSNKFISYT